MITPHHELEGPLVLVVDDFADGREIARCVVERMGMRVLEASNGHDGLDRAREHRPDLLILDLALPGIDGWTIAQELKSDPLTASIPILAFTAHAENTFLERARRAGCDRLLTKPCPPNTLAQAVRDLVGPSRSQAAVEKYG